ncbi:helix-turn-helix domain-containing protein [Marinobacterium sediminicola]|uniref:Helix-turn-helix domain-containing protein n=1 Tax=Marinobacterium sediminicola TaxID=518898 RepID=A0ABY1RXV6_9GAMM|nr:helix-turn-helix domain-containing protein [Marinobacterium sediminicola]ULG68555.1 helix-turn-helix domain-containing protein [Marinobacterium sediminicola]SMR73068.1 Helix-turn-helix domain-containing protein [Marinobacterium sediminicola]
MQPSNHNLEHAAAGRIALPDSSTSPQVNTLLALLQEGAMNTFDIRAHGIQHAAGRIADLRIRGHQIKTQMVWATDDLGLKHRIAQYHLVKENTHDH